MPEDHKPTTREILEELCLIPSVNILTMAKSVKEFVTMMIADGLIWATAPYYLPTAVRLHRQEQGHPFQGTSIEYTGGMIGACLGFAADGGQLYAYSNLVIHDHPEALAIPAATNVISGMYELGRVVYKRGRAAYMNARQRLVESRGEELSDILSPPTA